MISFEEAVQELFPGLTGSIKKKQIVEVCERYDIKCPKYILDPENKIAYGVYKYGEQLNTNSTTYVPVPVIVETDEEMDLRIRTSYECMEVLTEAVGNGVTPSMIISGAAGVGKSFTVKRVLESNKNTTVEFVKGYVKATGIYKLLWENRQSHQTLVFDDCDSIFEDVTALNLLKAALELTKTRLICWRSEKEFFDEDGEVIPNYFDYEGQVIFLTNIDFHELIQKGNKLSPHLSALESRSIYLDLHVRTNREKMMRITQVVNESTILEDRGVYGDNKQELMNYLLENVNALRDCSLRTIEKLAALYLASPTQWKLLADSVLLRR